MNLFKPNPVLAAFWWGVAATLAVQLFFRHI